MNLFSSINQHFCGLIIVEEIRVIQNANKVCLHGCTIFASDKTCEYLISVVQWVSLKRLPPLVEHLPSVHLALCSQCQGNVHQVV